MCGIAFVLSNAKICCSICGAAVLSYQEPCDHHGISKGAEVKSNQPGENWTPCLDQRDGGVLREVTTNIGPSVLDLAQELQRRGPDGVRHLSIPVADVSVPAAALNSSNPTAVVKQTGSVLHLIGAELQLRGAEVVNQPLRDRDGNILVFNGEIFGGIPVGPDENDGQKLLEALQAACACAPADVSIRDSTTPPPDFPTVPFNTATPPSNPTARSARDFNHPLTDVTPPSGDVSAPPTDVTLPPGDVTRPPSHVSDSPGGNASCGLSYPASTQEALDCKRCKCPTVVHILSGLRGPWALAYWQAKSQSLWYGRDFVGRRSLVAHLPDEKDGRFIVSSVAVSRRGLEGSGNGGCGVGSEGRGEIDRGLTGLDFKPGNGSVGKKEGTSKISNKDNGSQSPSNRCPTEPNPQTNGNFEGAVRQTVDFREAERDSEAKDPVTRRAENADGASGAGRGGPDGEALFDFWVDVPAGVYSYRPKNGAHAKHAWGDPLVAKLSEWRRERVEPPGDEVSTEAADVVAGDADVSVGPVGSCLVDGTDSNGSAVERIGLRHDQGTKHGEGKNGAEILKEFENAVDRLLDALSGAVAKRVTGIRDRSAATPRAAADVSGPGAVPADVLAGRGIASLESLGADSSESPREGADISRAEGGSQVVRGLTEGVTVLSKARHSEESNRNKDLSVSRAKCKLESGSGSDVNEECGGRSLDGVGNGVSQHFGSRCSTRVSSGFSGGLSEKCGSDLSNEFSGQRSRNHVGNGFESRDSRFKPGALLEKADVSVGPPADVAVLFSGGLDSMVLAALAGRYVPEGAPIDLINVCFDGGGSPDRLSARAGWEELRGLFPNRRWRLIEVDSSLAEVDSHRPRLFSLICPSQTYMDLNIGAALWLAARGRGYVATVEPSPSSLENVLQSDGSDHVLQSDCPEIESVGPSDGPDCMGNGLWGSLEGRRRQSNGGEPSCGERSDGPEQNRRKQSIRPEMGVFGHSDSTKKSAGRSNGFKGKSSGDRQSNGRNLRAGMQSDSSDVRAEGRSDGPESSAHSQGIPRDLYTSAARVLLVGSGADEQCAGYGRHRTKFREGGWQRLDAEMRLDVLRLWQRNLGRDDRCIADHGKEARFPFLDEDVMALLLSLPLWIVADLRQPSGAGDKKLLRAVARRLGIQAAAALPKRAIQFGSRIARASNRRDFGSNRAANASAAGGASIHK